MSFKNKFKQNYDNNPDVVDEDYKTIAKLMEFQKGSVSKAKLDNKKCPPSSTAKEKTKLRRKSSAPVTGNSSNADKEGQGLTRCKSISGSDTILTEDKPRRSANRRVTTELESLTKEQGNETLTEQLVDKKPPKSLMGKTEVSLKSMWKKIAKRATRKKYGDIEKDGDKSQSSSNSSNTLAENEIDCARDETQDMSKTPDEENSDPVYSLLKGAFMLRKGGEGDSSGVSSMRSLPRQSTASSGRSVSSRSSSPATKSASFSTTARPRQMLNKRMKSFSLDTPDAPKQVDESTKMKSSSYTNSTNIPGSNSSQACRRHMMFVRNKGMSIDYDDQISSSYGNSSSSLNSICSDSPRRAYRVPKTTRESEQVANGNLFVAIYDYTAKEDDCLTLRAGDRIAILDTSDPEWWFGSIEKRLGYFPHRYVLPFCEGQRLYRVGKPITLRANDEQDVKLLRGQVVIARGGEEFGNLNILSNDMKTGRMNEALCPIRYLQGLFM